MNRHMLIVVVGSFLALILGIVIAYPLLVSDFPSLSKTDISVDVVYVYIKPLASHSELTGLWWNNSVVNIEDGGISPVGATGEVVSYLVVLNVTNNFYESIRIKDFETIIGPQVTVDQSNGMTSASNPIIRDSRHLTYATTWDEIWTPYESRLIGLSGVVGIFDIPYAYLNNTSPLYLYGHAEGNVAYANAGGYANDYSLKQAKLQPVEDGFLFDAILKENQILLFYREYDVSIATRR